MLVFLLSVADGSDHDKLIYIYRTYHGDMLRFARCRLRTAALPDYETAAEDAVQNAFLKITKHIGSIDFGASEKELKTYLLSIVVNETINIINKQKSFDDIDDHANIMSEESFVEKLLISERYDRVMRAIESMDDVYRLALLYRFCKNYSVRKMAKLFGVKEKTVYTRIARAQKILLEILDKEKEI